MSLEVEEPELALFWDLVLAPRNPLRNYRQPQHFGQNRQPHLASDPDGLDGPCGDGGEDVHSLPSDWMADLEPIPGPMIRSAAPVPKPAHGEERRPPQNKPAAREPQSWVPWQPLQLSYGVA